MQASRHAGFELRVPRPVPEDWRERLLGHLLRLSPDSRRRRFFVWMPDEAVARYVARTAPAAIVEARIDGRTRGMAELHLPDGPGGEAEIAVSVKDAWQRRGIGAALVAQAISEAALRGAGQVSLFYQPGNAAMRKIARRAGFVRVPHGDPSLVQARLVLPGQETRRPRFH